MQEAQIHCKKQWITAQKSSEFLQLCAEHYEMLWLVYQLLISTSVHRKAVDKFHSFENLFPAI